MRRIGTWAVVLSLALFASQAQAQDDSDKEGASKEGRPRAEGRGPRGGREAGERGRRGGEGGPRERGPREGGPREGGRPDMNPEAMAARMIENFDSNGDKALDAKELAKALTAMRERFSGRRPGGPEGRRGPPEGGPREGRPGPREGGRRPSPRPAE